MIRELLLKRRNWTGVRVDTVLADSNGGFIARFAEAELDLTLSQASIGLRESTLVEVAQVLFGDER